MKSITTFIVLVTLTYNVANAQANYKTQLKMKIAVWDTYVTKKDGSTMHFDIIAPQEIKDSGIIYAYGKNYLKTKGQGEQPLTAKECSFCHIETIKSQWEDEIKKKGYFIIEMENCN